MRELLGMIALPGREVVNCKSLIIKRPGGLKPLVAGFSVRGFKLIQLRFPLRGELAFCGLAIQIRSRAVIQSSVEIHPDLNSGASVVFGAFRSLSETKLNQHPVEKGKACIGSGLPLGRGRRCRTSTRFYGMIRPNAPTDHASDQDYRDGQIDVATARVPEPDQPAWPIARCQLLQEFARRSRGTPVRWMRETRLHKSLGRTGFVLGAFLFIRGNLFVFPPGHLCRSLDRRKL